MSLRDLRAFFRKFSLSILEAAFWAVVGAIVAFLAMAFTGWLYQ